MSAAPAPPPHLHPVGATNYGSENEGGRRASIVAPNGDDGHYGASGRPQRVLPNIRDLVYEAESRVDMHEPIKTLLNTAELAAKQANTFVDFRRPDKAYTEYLLATHIVSKIIPRHKDQPFLQSDSHGYGHSYRSLIKKLNAESSRFDGIRDLIILDNQKSGVQPSLGPNAPPVVGRVQDLADGTLTATNGSDYFSRSLRKTDNSSGPRESSDAPRRVHIIQASEKLVGSGKPKPPIHPKPQSLQSLSIAGRSSPVQATDTDALSQRFARLRAGSGAAQSDGVSTPSTLELNSVGHTATLDRSAAAQWTMSPESQTTRDLPKPPSPTYSPIRSSLNGAALQPPRSSRARPDQDISRPSSASSTNAMEGHSNPPYPTTLNSSANLSNGSVLRKDPRPLAGQTRRKSINLPRETEIDALRLYDYLRNYNVLLLDVRDRVEYDSGHIFAQSGMCIEPTALRPDMSASELQDSLVLSPEVEQAMFDRRDQYDLVVYYDQSTRTRAFLQGRGNVVLKFVHDALYDYNHDKPLRYPPVLLVGGMDAWVDLMGRHALQTSRTAGVRQPVRPVRPLARVPLPSNVSTLSIQKRRLRDYNPLDADEERKWRERARSESYVLDTQEQSEEQPEPEPEPEDDFDRRFPDIASVERQSVAAVPPHLPPPIPRIPNYPTPHIPSLSTIPNLSSVPSVPARPPPTVPRRSYSGISERVSSPSPLSKTTQLPHYIPPKLKRLPRTGLHNFGVTCYMNASIQCLSATIPLTAFFMEGQYFKYVQPANWKGSKGLMPELYHILLRNLWTATDVDTLRPTNFRKFCARLNQEWGIDRQQDAKEFLDFLVDTLHEDLNVNWNRTPLRPLTDEEEAQRERTPPFVAAKREWERYLHRDHSRLTDLFAGQHISRLQCTTCGHSSTTYEPFYSVSVEIPPAPSSGRVDLRDCLRSYCSAETLRGDEVWRCPHCRTEREATKRITISRAPEFLVVHLKRFSAGRSERARKIHTPVDFPLHGLDLEPFMLPAPDAAARDAAARKYGPGEREAPPAMSPPYRYDAYAVLRHLGGTMTSGHYIALVEDKARACWREFNDDKVTDFRPEDLPGAKRLQNEQAYIVFYQRVRVE